MGHSNSGGHAFVCDGYKDLTFGKKFHFNFGWNGNYDGFYRINNPQGFSISQSAIIYLHAKNCNSYKEINWFDKYSIGHTLFYYNPVFGTIYSSPSYVIIQNNEVVHYRAYNEIILENFETEGNAEFIAEIISCNSCDFIDYKYSKDFLGNNYISEKKQLTKVFPNPFSKTLNVISDNQNSYVSLIDIYGKYIIKEKPIIIFNNYDLSSLNNGIYILQIKDKNEIENIKIIKQ